VFIHMELTSGRAKDGQADGNTPPTHLSALLFLYPLLYLSLCGGFEEALDYKFSSYELLRVEAVMKC